MGLTRVGESVAAEYVAARRAVLDALTALRKVPDPFVMVGAQAIYLRTGAVVFDAAVAPFTTDADIAFDPQRLGGEPQLEEVMQAAGFQRSDQPGTWTTMIQVGERRFEVPVDLIVPEALAGPGRRAARLPEQEKNVARRSRGLEAALVDNSLMTVGSFDDADDRVLNVAVAGTAALFIAKAHKLAERINATPYRPDRVKPKDASDVFRLLQAEPAARVGRRLGELTHDPVAGEVVVTGVRHLVNLFGRRGRPGIQLAIRALGAGAVPSDRVAALFVAYLAELQTAYAEVLR
jgi:hypothetical protein